MTGFPVTCSETPEPALAKDFDCRLNLLFPESFGGSVRGAIRRVWSKRSEFTYLKRREKRSSFRLNLAHAPQRAK